MQNRLDEALLSMNASNLLIPSCLKMFEHKFDIIEREKLEGINDQIAALRLQNENYLRRINIFNRNEKYKYQGYHALQAMNPYIVGKEDKIYRNLKSLGICRNRS